MLAINDLPDEVLMFIFVKLPLENKKNVRLVNKRFLSACNGASVTKHELVHLTTTELCFFKTLKCYLNLVIYNVGLRQVRRKGQSQARFWIRHGKSVRSVSVDNFNSKCLKLDQIIKHCPNILELTLHFTPAGCQETNVVENNTGSTLDSLQHLCLRGLYLSKFVRAEDLFTLTERMPNLKTLKFYSLSVLKSELMDIEALIAKHSSTLTQLGFTFCDFVQEPFLDNVGEQMMPRLTRLYLYEGESAAIMVNSSIVSLLSSHANNLPNLQSLELHRISLNKNCSLSELVKFKNLNILSFSGTSLTKKQVKSLKGVSKQLKGLDLGQTDSTADAILKVFGDEMHPNLIALKLGWMVSVRTDANKALETILPNVPNLKLLDLMSCDDVCSIGIEAIVTNCKKLTHLSLDRCDDKRLGLITSASINNLVILVHLVHLNLTFCQVPHKILLKLRFRELTSLGLSGKILSQQAVCKLLKNCPKLGRMCMGYVDDQNVYKRLARIIPKKLRHVFVFEHLHEKNIFDYCSC